LDKRGCVHLAILGRIPPLAQHSFRLSGYPWAPSSSTARFCHPHGPFTGPGDRVSSRTWWIGRGGTIYNGHESTEGLRPCLVRQSLPSVDTELAPCACILLAVLMGAFGIQRRGVPLCNRARDKGLFVLSVGLPRAPKYLSRAPMEYAQRSSEANDVLFLATALVAFGG